MRCLSAKRSKWVLYALIAGLVGGLGGTLFLIATRGSREDSPPNASGAPTPRSSGQFSPLPRGEGGKVPCSSLPFSAAVAREYGFHDCWRFELGGYEYEFFMGGIQPEDPEQGVLYVDVPKHDTKYFQTPSRTGSVTIYYANVNLICYTTAKGEHGAFSVAEFRYLSTAETRSRCPSP